MQKAAEPDDTLNRKSTAEQIDELRSKGYKVTLEIEQVHGTPFVEPEPEPEPVPEGVAEMARYLNSMGIRSGPAQTYAEALDKQGYDTIVQFQTLSLDALESDFGFKQGHREIVKQFRDAGDMATTARKSWTDGVAR
jgi:hypothetical protein